MAGDVCDGLRNVPECSRRWRNLVRFGWKGECRGLCLEHRPLWKRASVHATRVPDSSCTCPSDKSFRTMVDLSFSKQHRKHPLLQGMLGSSAVFTASTKTGHCFVRFNLMLTMTQKSMLCLVHDAHGEEGGGRAALWTHLGENIEWGAPELLGWIVVCGAVPEKSWISRAEPS